MTTRAKIELLQQEVGVDYAFGIVGLLALADALDELSTRVAGFESRLDEHRMPDSNGAVSSVDAVAPVDTIASADIVAELAEFRRQLVKLTKAVKKRRK
jgi:hypothetical protein